MPPVVPRPKPGPCPKHLIDKVADVVKPGKRTVTPKVSKPKKGKPAQPEKQSVTPTVAKPDEPAAGGRGRRATGPGSGRDLLGGLDYEDLAGKTPGLGRAQAGDLALAEIAARQGFDGPPKLGSAHDLDKLVSDGGVELFRGVTAADGRSAAELAEQFRSGPAFYGMGLGVNGIYTAGRATATRFAEGDQAGVIRMVLDPKAKVISFDQARSRAKARAGSAQARFEREQRRLMQEVDRATTRGDFDGAAAALARYEASRARATDEQEVLWDVGRWAAAAGYDAIRASQYDGSDYHVILNRTAVTAETPERETARTASARVQACLPPHVPVPRPGPCPGPKRLGGLVKKAVRSPRNVAAAETAAPGRAAGRDVTGELDYAQLIGQVPAVGDHADDRALAAIAAVQGFDGVPQRGSPQQLGEMIRAGGVELFRGVKPIEGGSAAQLAEQFRSGPAFYGRHGVHGNGIYFGGPDVADEYARSKQSGVIRAVLRPDAKVIDHTALRDLWRAESGADGVEAAERQHDLLAAVAADARLGTRAEIAAKVAAYEALRAGADGRSEVLFDPGRFAAAKGFDAIRVAVRGRRDPYYVLLNRTAVLAEDPAMVRRFDDAPAPVKTTPPPQAARVPRPRSAVPSVKPLPTNQHEALMDIARRRVPLESTDVSMLPKPTVSALRAKGYISQNHTYWTKYSFTDKGQEYLDAFAPNAAQIAAKKAEIAQLEQEMAGESGQLRSLTSQLVRRARGQLELLRRDSYAGVTAPAMPVAAG